MSKIDCTALGEKCWHAFASQFPGQSLSRYLEGPRRKKRLSGLGAIGNGKESGYAGRGTSCGAGNLILTLSTQSRGFHAPRIVIFFVFGLFFQTHDILIGNFPAEMP